MHAKIWIQLEQHPDTGIMARWYLPDSVDETLHSASLEDFRNWKRAAGFDQKNMLRAVLLLSGEQVVTRSLVFAANEKKHLQKLLPFMLESQLAVDLSQVHVAHRLPAQTQTDRLTVQVAYTDKKQLQWRVDELESLGLEVESVFSIPALLPASDEQWSLLLDGNLCHLHATKSLCTSIEPELVSVLLDTAVEGFSEQTHIPELTLLSVGKDAANQPDTNVLQARTLLQTLSRHDAIKSAGINISAQSVRHVWKNLAVSGRNAVDLRQGELAAPLRLGKHWQQWRVPALAAMVATSAVLLTAAVETQINQYRFRALDARIEQRYREVMPEGVLVDAVQQLSAQVSQRRATTASRSLTRMLDDMLEPFENADSVTLHRLSYSAGNTNGTEIQLIVSAPDTADILTLGENLTAAGLTAQAQNISRTGDSQQANLLVRGN